MPSMFLEYYDKEALTWIGNRIGEIIKIDINTSGQLTGHYARICVLVDLSKQLMSGFSLDGEDYYVEYEGLHWLCTNCGVYGHKAENYKTGGDATKTGAVDGDGTGKENSNDTTMEEGSRRNQELWRVVQNQVDKKEGEMRSNKKVSGSTARVPDLMIWPPVRRRDLTWKKKRGRRVLQEQRVLALQM